jgi:pimeloyl-ACP methyl ester carboxylesterase
LSLLTGNPVSPFTLVILPGLNGTDILFRPLLAALPQYIRPIVVSYPRDRRLSYEQLFPLVLAALPESEPFILFGESFSGPLAVMTAARCPPNLRGVIFCATFVTRPIPWIAWAVPLLARGFVFRLFPTFKQMKALFGGYSTPQLRELFRQLNMDPAEIAFRVRQVLQVDVRQELIACRLPMLYIAAAKDRTVPARNFRLMQRLQPTLKLVTLDAPHGIAQTRPNEVAEIISRFAEQVLQTAASNA